eukprot:jgi/Mesvir1/27646/Mv07375-RA.1
MGKLPTRNAAQHVQRRLTLCGGFKRRASRVLDSAEDNTIVMAAIAMTEREKTCERKNFWRLHKVLLSIATLVIHGEPRLFARNCTKADKPYGKGLPICGEYVESSSEEKPSFYVRCDSPDCKYPVVHVGCGVGKRIIHDLFYDCREDTGGCGQACASIQETWISGLEALHRSPLRDRDAFRELVEAAHMMANAFEEDEGGAGDREGQGKPGPSEPPPDCALPYLLSYKKRLRSILHMFGKGKQGLNKIRRKLGDLITAIRDGVTGEDDEHEEVCKGCGHSPDGWLVVCDRKGCKNSWCTVCMQNEPPKGDFYCSMVPGLQAPILKVSKLNQFPKFVQLVVTAVGWPTPHVTWMRAAELSNGMALTPLPVPSSEVTVSREDKDEVINGQSVVTHMVTTKLRVGLSDAVPVTGTYTCYVMNCLGKATTQPACPHLLIAGQPGRGQPGGVVNGPQLPDDSTASSGGPATLPGTASARHTPTKAVPSLAKPPAMSPAKSPLMNSTKRKAEDPPRGVPLSPTGGGSSQKRPTMPREEPGWAGGKADMQGGAAARGKYMFKSLRPPDADDMLDNEEVVHTGGTVPGGRDGYVSDGMTKHGASQPRQTICTPSGGSSSGPLPLDVLFTFQNKTKKFRVPHDATLAAVLAQCQHLAVLRQPTSHLGSGCLEMNLYASDVSVSLSVPDCVPSMQIVLPCFCFGPVMYLPFKRRHLSPRQALESMTGLRAEMQQQADTKWTLKWTDPDDDLVDIDTPAEFADNVATLQEVARVRGVTPGRPDGTPGVKLKLLLEENRFGSFSFDAPTSTIMPYHP